MPQPFRFDWGITLFSTVSMAAFIMLGFWQLQRATEKEFLIALDESRQAQPVVELTRAPTASSELQGLPVVLNGLYETERFFLLDNRVLRGRVGFELLLPFQVDDGPLVMVNRGFVVMGRTRDEVPLVPGITGGAKAEGRIYVAQEGSFGFKEDLSEVTSWPRIVQRPDPVMLESLLGEPLYPHIVRLNAGDPNALPRNWSTTAMRPAKHMGYAVQWFVMAIAVFIAFMFFSFRTNLAKRSD